MLDNLTAPNHNSAYRPLLDKVLKHGDEITVRGRPTREILNNVVEVVNPRQRVVTVAGRRWNPFLAASEGLWIIGGMKNVDVLLPYNSRAGDFSDDGETNYGAYGERMYRDGALPKLINLLKSDPDTRRASLPIYFREDIGADSKDVPCNVFTMWKLREGRLHLTVINRSNDIHWGLFAVNFCQFSMLQEVVAYCVGANVGTQTHLSNSLHVYTDDIGDTITKSMLDSWYLPEQSYSNNDWPAAPIAPGVVDIENHKLLARSVLYGTISQDNPSWYRFMNDYLAAYRTPLKRNKVERMMRVEIMWHDKGFDDWIYAGREFLGMNNG